MDLDKLIRKLRIEREHLDSIIASLERLQQSAAVVKKKRVKKRRGRKFMEREGAPARSLNG